MAGIEAPVEDLFGPDPDRQGMCVATLEVAVQPGTDFVVETGASPWVFGGGDAEGERRLLLAQERSLQALSLIHI